MGGVTGECMPPFGVRFFMKMLNSVGDSLVGRLAWDLSLVEPNLVAANDAVVKVVVDFLFRKFPLLGTGGIGLVELGKTEAGAGDVEVLHPLPGGVGEEGDMLRLVRDEDNESMGLKLWASGLKPLLAAWISRSIIS